MAGIENRLHAFDRALLQPDFHERPDDGTDHLLEKSIRVGCDHNGFAELVHVQVLQMAMRILIVGGRPFKTRAEYLA